MKFLIVKSRRSPVAEYPAHAAACNYLPELGRNDVFYRAVVRADYVAAVYRVPQGYAVPLRQRLFLFDRRGRALTEQCGDERPEPVLRMPIEKHLLARLDRRQAPEDKYLGFGVKKRSERVRYMRMV